MLDPETGNVIVFNGEIYNFQKLRRECEAAGARFRSRSDTEVILALYRRFGPDCVRQLRGMFALAIWDAHKSELFLARDRFGKKPLNYALTRQGLVFCSEIDPLSRHPTVSRDHDNEALELYLQFLCVPAPWTIYKSIRKLPPAHWAIFSEKGLRLQQYWDIDYSRKIQISDEEAFQAFDEKFTEAVRMRMVADVPLGALLSGGVDSSAVVAMMAKLSSVPVKTFSVGFGEQAFNELPHARRVAQVCGTDHHEQIVTYDFGSLLPRMIRHYGEPFADSSAIPSFLVCESARKHVTVVLNGDGGDELLGGYPRYRLSRFALFGHRLLGRSLPSGPLLDWTVNYRGNSQAWGRALSLGIRNFLRPEFGSLINFRGNWEDVARARLLPGGDRALVRNWRNEWIARAGAHSHNPFDWMLYFDNHTSLPNDLLVKMDIASMHCGLEARSPLLDHELAEFCASLPLDRKLRGGEGKLFLKRTAARTFGKAFANRKKQGFGIPLEAWLKGPLRQDVMGTIADRDLMASFDPDVVSRTAKEFFSGGAGPSHVYRIWALFMYGLWKNTVATASVPNENPVAVARASLATGSLRETSASGLAKV
jgi:asparagine synthase (glutamine-hydrolysing)